MTKERTGQEILIVDDDVVFNDLMVSQLSRLGYDTTGVRSWAEAQAHLETASPDLVLLDVQLPDAHGIDLLEELIGKAPVILLTAYGSIRTAVQAMKQGAADYLVKPVDLDELALTIKRVLGYAELQEEIRFVRSRDRATRKSFMVGNGAALEKINDLIDAVAGAEVTVLITGESGVGKELVAREIHERSGRAEKSYLALDCCTLQESLFESELFGHEKGAFTSADSQKKGLIEGARDGTLFLDEIGEIGPSIQAKLLRVLETGAFRRVGGTKNLHSDTRILAATNRDLEAMAKEGDFRTDLYYRLAAFVIEVPPLRKRREDIPDLVEHFLNRHDFSRRISKKVSKAALDILIAYDWPGNVRELRNIIERAIIISGDAPVIHAAHLGLDLNGVGRREAISFSFDHEPTLEELKADYLRKLHEKYNGRRSKLADAMGISERNLYRLLKKLDLETG